MIVFKGINGKSRLCNTSPGDIIPHALAERVVREVHGQAEEFMQGDSLLLYRDSERTPFTGRYDLVPLRPVAGVQEFVIMDREANWPLWPKSRQGGR